MLLLKSDYIMMEKKKKRYEKKINILKNWIIIIILYE